MLLPPADDRGAALFVVAMDLHAIPDPVEVIRVTARECVDGGAVCRIDDEDAADRRLAIAGDQRARGHDIDGVILGAVEMDAMRAIMLSARGQNVFLVDGVDDEQHGGTIPLRDDSGRGGE